MAGVVPRIFYRNLIQLAGVLLTPSSELPSLPRGRLRDQLRTAVWRTKSGWTFEDPNKHLDFTEAGNARVAIVDLGTSSVAADVATNVQTAMNTAVGHTNTYTVTYDSGTKKFTIARATGSDAVVLKFGDGANLATSIHLDLGFTDGNKTGSTTYTAENVSFQSRHWIEADLLSAFAFDVAAIINHNLLAGGSVRLDAHSSSMVSAGLASAPGGAFSQVLPGTSLRQAYFAEQTKRYLRLVIVDVQNPVAYGEIGIAFVGPHLEVRSFAPDVGDGREELSEISFAVHGAHYQTGRQTRRVWDLILWRRSVTEKTALETMADFVKVGGSFFFDFDSATPQIRYVFLDKGMAFQSADTVPITWDVTLQLSESLG